MIVRITDLKGNLHILPAESIITMYSGSEYVEDSLYNLNNPNKEAPLYREIDKNIIYTEFFTINVTKEEFDRIYKLYEEAYENQH